MLTFEAMAVVERNWHITVPGFGSEEYRAYKRPVRFLFLGFCIKTLHIRSRFEDTGVVGRW
jgi:hypothetical protein